MSNFVLTSSTWAPGFPSHYGTIMMWLIEFPLRMPLWEQCRIFGMTIMLMYTLSISYFAQGIARNMRYLEYTSTWFSSQKADIAPIEAFTESILLATSWSSLSEKENQEPKYLKWGQNVTLPFATSICFVSVSAMYKISSRLHLFSCDSPLTCLDLLMCIR